MTEPTLNPQAIDAALEYVAARWPNHPFSASQREAWSDVLVYLYPGELKPALARLSSDWRPDPDKVLAAAVGNRTHEAPSNDWSHPHPDGPAPEPDIPYATRMIEEIRAANHLTSHYRKETT